MADSSITAKDAGGATVTIDTQDVASSGQHQQVVTIGDGANVGRVVAVDSGGAASVRERATSTATLANVSATTSSTTIKTSNTARRGLWIWNDSATATLYVDLSGGTASATSCSFSIAPGGVWEMPAPFTGTITGIWSAASGAARVTELT